MKISIIIPVYNNQTTIQRLLVSVFDQSDTNFEVIVVDDCSTDDTPDIVKTFPCRLFRLDKNRGPAYCRNLGAGKTSGDILVFTDGDCIVDKNWIRHIKFSFAQNTFDALMGKVILPPSTILGDAISALGFPAGGSVGFDKIWKVDQDGYTKSISSCNCAIKKDAFACVGGFDETFPYPGGEDSLLAYHLVQKGFRIKYCPEVKATHEARSSMISFIKWQFRRGVSSFLFSKKVEKKQYFVSLRLWSAMNIIRTYCRDIKFPIIAILLAFSYSIQLTGFLYAGWIKKGKL